MRMVARNSGSGGKFKCQSAKFKETSNFKAGGVTWDALDGRGARGVGPQKRRRTAAVRDAFARTNDCQGAKLRGHPGRATLPRLCLPKMLMGSNRCAVCTRRSRDCGISSQSGDRSPHSQSPFGPGTAQWPVAETAVLWYFAIMRVLTEHRFTVKEYYRMAETGVLRPDARVELLEEGLLTCHRLVRFMAAWLIV